MALVRCSECGTECSALAAACPRCGHPNSSQPAQYPHQPFSTGQQTQIVNVTVDAGATRPKKWNPALAAILSLLIPGLGQAYKGQAVNGLAWFLIVIAGYFAMVLPGVILHACCAIGAMMGDPYKK